MHETPHKNEEANISAAHAIRSALHFQNRPHRGQSRGAAKWGDNSQNRGDNGTNGGNTRYTVLAAVFKVNLAYAVAP